MLHFEIFSVGLLLFTMRKKPDARDLVIELLLESNFDLQGEIIAEISEK